MKNTKRLSTSVTITLATIGMLVACGGGSDETTGDGDGDSTTGTGGGVVGDGDTGGTTGDGDTGGTVGDGDGDMGAPVTFTFDSGLDGLSFNYEEGAGWALMGMGMGGSGSYTSDLEFEASEGEPEAGSAKLTIPFDWTGTEDTYEDAGYQKVGVSLPIDPALDLTSKTVTVQAKLVSTTVGADCYVQAKLFLKTGDYIWGNGAAVGLVEGAWTELSMAASTPEWTADDAYDASDVVEVGVEIAADATAGCTTGESVVLLDSFSL